MGLVELLLYKILFEDNSDELYSLLIPYNSVILLLSLKLFILENLFKSFNVLIFLFEVKKLIVLKFKFSLMLVFKVESFKEIL